MLWSVVLELGAPRAVSLESAGESGVWSLESLSQRNFLEAGLCCAGIIFFSKSSGIPLLYIPGIRDMPGTRDIPGKSARYIASALKTNFFKPATSV